MKVPKKIERLLNRKEYLAYELAKVNCELDNWLENHGADLSSSPLCDCTVSGCMIYCEPTNSKLIVRSYIEDNM